MADHERESCCRGVVASGRVPGGHVSLPGRCSLNQPSSYSLTAVCAHLRMKGNRSHWTRAVRKEVGPQRSAELSPGSASRSEHHSNPSPGLPGQRDMLIRLRFLPTLALSALWPIPASAQLVKLDQPTATLAEQFSFVRGARELSSGQVILVDWSENRVVIADFATNSVRRLMREGPGPQEFACRAGSCACEATPHCCTTTATIARISSHRMVDRCARSWPMSRVGAEFVALTRLVPSCTPSRRGRKDQRPCLMIPCASCAGILSSPESRRWSPWFKGRVIGRIALRPCNRVCPWLDLPRRTAG